jgi:hypothetical protein
VRAIEKELFVKCGLKVHPWARKKRATLGGWHFGEPQVVFESETTQLSGCLAELIRSGQLIASEKDKESNKRWEYEQPWRNLLIRLAEDRFTLDFCYANPFHISRIPLFRNQLGQILKLSFTAEPASVIIE